MCNNAPFLSIVRPAIYIIFAKLKLGIQRDHLQLTGDGADNSKIGLSGVITVLVGSSPLIRATLPGRDILQNLAIFVN